MAEQPSGSVGHLTFVDVAVRDPLTPVTRKERLYLLAVSMIGIAILKTGLVPSKIATFGIELEKPDRSALLFLLALVTVYFLVAFIIYAASDYVTRDKELRTARKREQSEKRSRLRYLEVAIRLNTTEENVRKLYHAGELEAYARQKISEEQDWRDILQILEAPELKYDMVFQAVYRDRQEINYEFLVQEVPTWAARARVFFDFFLPPIVGLYAIYTLLFGAFVIPEIVASTATFGVIGVIAGIVAKLLAPGYDPLGIIPSVFIGVVGAFIGGFVANTLAGPGVSGVNLTSIVMASLGTLTLLTIYRLLTHRIWGVET